jgi:hypothetical protein
LLADTRPTPTGGSSIRPNRSRARGHASPRRLPAVR